jgi:hypothetical protein
MAGDELEYNEVDQRINDLFKKPRFAEDEKEDRPGYEDEEFLSGVIPESDLDESEQEKVRDDLEAVERQLSQAFGTLTDPSKDIYGEWDLKDESFVSEDSFKLVYRVDSERWDQPEGYDSRTSFVNETMNKRGLEDIQLTEVSEDEETKEIYVTLEYMGTDDRELEAETAQSALEGIAATNKKAE